MTPPVDGAALRAALEASCLRGALPPVDLPETLLVKNKISDSSSSREVKAVERRAGVYHNKQHCDGVVTLAAIK